MADHERVGWVGSPDERGTAQILITCLSTIFLCTYTVLHHDVPTKGQSTLRQYCHRIVYMLCAIMAPEFVLSFALRDLRDASHNLKLLRGLGINWTLTHAFFIKMGGFEFEGRPVQINSVDQNDKLDLLDLAREGLVDFEAISEADVRNTGQADPLVKALACLQAIYLIAQIIARAIQGLPVSCLEVGSVAYVPLTLATYGCWWRKVACRLLQFELAQ